MRKRGFAILILGALLASVFGLSGCYEQEVPEPEWKVSGYFKYTEIEYEEDGATKEGICIVKLTDEGGEQEIIYIPTEIDGKPVVKVGMLDQRNPLTMGKDPSYYSLPQKTKRVYIPWQIQTVNPGMFQSDHDLWLRAANVDLIIEECTIYGNKGARFLYPPQSNLSSKSHVTYFFNYPKSPNENIFMVDGYAADELLVKLAIEPNRDGYIFAGWYKEADCINAWDFENEKQGEDYISLYAKWIKE